MSATWTHATWTLVPFRAGRLSVSSGGSDESLMAISERPPAATRRLTIKQTRTGYWVVQRGGISIAGAMTRKAAEGERELLRRLGERRLRRPRPAAASPRG